MDANKVGAFMGNLTRNRFLTVLNSSIRGIDRDIAQDRAYVYGSNPVVQLSLDCEAVFFRDWTKALMPAPIKKLLNVEETPPAGATPVALR